MIRVGSQVQIKIQGTVKQIYRGTDGLFAMVQTARGFYYYDPVSDLIEVGQEYDPTNDGPEVQILREKP